MGGTEACVGRTPPAVALRYQHMMAGRDQAIARCPGRAGPGRRQPPTAASDREPSGTLVAGTRRAKPEVQAAALLVDADLGCLGEMMGLELTTPACKARSGRITCPYDERRRLRPPWCCPWVSLGTARDCCEWHASGMAGEDDGGRACQLRHQLNYRGEARPGAACILLQQRRSWT
jgi:hypothetical protein